MALQSAFTIVPSRPTIPLRILVLDDDDRVRDVLVRLLKTQGHCVEESSSGREALTIFTRGTFDVVMTDQTMPEMSGCQMWIFFFQSLRGSKISSRQLQSSHQASAFLMNLLIVRILCSVMIATILAMMAKRNTSLLAQVATQEGV